MTAMVSRSVTLSFHFFPLAAVWGALFPCHCRTLVNRYQNLHKNLTLPCNLPKLENFSESTAFSFFTFNLNTALSSYRERNRAPRNNPRILSRRSPDSEKPSSPFTLPSDCPFSALSFYPPPTKWLVFCSPRLLLIQL